MVINLQNTKEDTSYYSGDRCLKCNVNVQRQEKVSVSANRLQNLITYRWVLTLRDTSTLDMTWEFLLAHNTNAVMRPSSISICFLLLLQS